MNEFKIDSVWIGLPLSARGLARELASFLGSDDSFKTCLPLDSTPRAVGDEVARLLCAYRDEYGRIRRDVERLLDQGILSIEASTLRLRASLPNANDATASVLKSTSAERMRRHRELAKARSVPDGSSHVTGASVTLPVTGDDAEASHVTSSLSFKQVKDLHPKRERDRRDASHRMPADLAFGDNARAIAKRVGVKEPELTWMAFKAHYLERGTSARDWERVWETWVVREAKWEAAHGPRPPKSTSAPVDLDAPWLRMAGGES